MTQQTSQADNSYWYQKPERSTHTAAPSTTSTQQDLIAAYQKEQERRLSLARNVALYLAKRQ